MSQRSLRYSIGLVAFFLTANAATAPVFAQRSTASRARIALQDACGWQGQGRIAYLHSTARNLVHVTVRESYNAGPVRRSSTMTMRLEPGAQQRLGCTRGDTSSEWRSFEIVGQRG